MAAQKVYQIQINGLTESVKAVDALNESLKTLEARIKALEGKSVSVGSKSSGGSSKSSSLSEEEKLQKQIEQLEEKRIVHSKEIYQNYLAAKDVLKETEQDQKQIAAAERMAADSYSNTIQGMKQELADIKTVMQTVDLGDTEQLDKMVKRANELNTELKKVEESYGQFGRNVGNYASAADGFNKFKIEVGGVTREFNTAREAAKTLSNELLNLPKGAKGAEELRAALQQIKSEMQDINKSSASMDKLLDTMEGFVAVANLGQGIRGLFGVDDAEIQKSIKNLVALQNVLKGIETINKQINTREGIGAWIAPFTTSIDKATAKLLTFNTALLGTGKAAKVASVSIKAFSKALKAALSMGILVVVDLLIDGLMKLVDSFKKVDEEAERQKNVQKELAEAYGEAQGKLIQYKSKVDSFNGSKKEEKKLVEELNREFGSTLGTYKSLAEWQDVLKKKGDAYIQTLINQAKAQAALNEVTAAYMNLENVKQKAANGDYKHWYQSQQQDAEAAARAVEEANQRISKAEENLKNIITENEKYAEKHGLGNYAPQIKKNGKKTENAIEKIQNEITKKEIDAMEDGLNKKLRQLDEEERQTINKLKQNGRKTSDEINKIQRVYNALRQKEIKEYLKKLEEEIRTSANEIKKIQFTIDISDIDNKIDDVKNKFDELSKDVPVNNELLTNTEFRNLVETKGLKKASRDINAFAYSQDAQLDNFFNARYEAAKKFYDDTIKLLKDNIKEQGKLEQERINKQYEQDWEAERQRYTRQANSLSATVQSTEYEIKHLKIRNEKDVELQYKLMQDLSNLYGQQETALKQHSAKLDQITDAKNNAIKKSEIDTLNEIQAAQERYYNQQLSNYRDFLSKINSEASKNPIAGKNWGIVNIPQTKKNYNEIINASKEALREIEGDKEKLEKDFKEGFISKEAYNATKNQLNDLERDVRNAQVATEEASSYLVANFVQSIQVYLQEALNSFNQIMQSVWNAQDIQYDKEKEQLDKELDALEENLNMQEQLIEQHKSKVDSIEDELATARGDRRQHLIDQLNAEMEAERAAYKEKQLIEKQEEANKKKQEKLDRERTISQYHRDKLQAIVNGAMAVTMAAINKWPIPAIPMMALAASTTAAQLAIMAANKPYANGGQLDGGVAQGNRHRDGGIKVLGGRAEIEGGEFITNRLTTEKNINLLEYINSKKKRIDINDLVEFYSSGSVKKNIMKMSPKSKFADGGYIPPTLSTTIEIEDKLLDSFERYSNRPVVVSVVDITSKQDDVRRVQTLAGL